MLRGVRTENLEGTNNNNAAGIAAFNQWYDGPVGSKLRQTFRITERTTINPTTGETVATLTSDSRNAEVFETADVVSTGRGIRGRPQSHVALADCLQRQPRPRRAEQCRPQSSQRLRGTAAGNPDSGGHPACQ
jgi:hypothetical protein